MTIEFTAPSGVFGAGVYRLVDGEWVFAGSLRADGTVCAGITTGGMYMLGFDATPPRMEMVSAGDGVMEVLLGDEGCGIDMESIAVTCGGAALSFRYNPLTSTIVVGGADPDTITGQSIEISVSDRSGNRKNGVFDARNIAPDRIILDQNHPNPFNPTTVIGFETPVSRVVRIEVYDLLGRRVRLLADSTFPEGRHTLVWDARDDNGRAVSSGVYMYRAIAGNRAVSRKMLLMR
jgi:hypothetical protein